MLAFVALGVAVVVLIVVNEWNIRSVRASRRSLLASNIRLLELDLGVGEPEPSPFEMTDEPGQMITLEGCSYPTAIPQWYDEYHKMLMMPRMFVPRDSQSDLEVW